jgi:hypothetical protein
MDELLKFWSSQGCEVLNQWGQPKDHFDLIVTSARNRNHSRQIYEKIPHVSSWPRNSSGVNPKIRSCGVHLRVRKARSCSYLRPKREIDHVDLISDRLPCDHISEITVPRDHAVAAEKPRLVNLIVKPHWQRTNCIDVLAARFCEELFTAQPFYELYFLLAKKLSCRRTLRYAFAHACI